MKNWIKILITSIYFVSIYKKFDLTEIAEFVVRIYFLLFFRQKVLYNEKNLPYSKSTIFINHFKEGGKQHDDGNYRSTRSSIGFQNFI